jgi:hypothetical protein
VLERFAVERVAVHHIRLKTQVEAVLFANPLVIDQVVASDSHPRIHMDALEALTNASALARKVILTRRFV